MPQEPRLTREEQETLTQRLREWIRQEESRGIPVENILISCGECGLVDLVDETGEEEEPAPFEE
ncbi:MAG: hypothetical protein QGI11_00130 [Nitrospinota bacterium]|nr:hypothetical protein [Nitrospinota bacterium]